MVVYFFHAFPLSSKMWRPQIEFLESKGIKCVAFDYLIKGMKSIFDYGEFCRERIKENEDKVFVGLSMGGYVILSFFEKVSKLKGIVLADTRASGDIDEIKKKRYEIIEDITRMKSIIPAIEFYFPKLLAKKTFLEKKDLVREIRNIMLEVDWEAAVDALKAIAERPDFTEKIKNSNIPKLLLCGENDSLSPPDMMKKLADEISAEIKIISSAGHLSNLENPKEFNSYLLEFINT